MLTYSLNLEDFRTINLMMKFYEGLWDLIYRKKREKKETENFRLLFVVQVVVVIVVVVISKQNLFGTKFGCVDFLAHEYRVMWHVMRQ